MKSSNYQVAKQAHILFSNCFDVLAKCYEEREAKSIASQFLEDAFGISKMDIMLKKSINYDSSDFEEKLDRLKKLEPVQYVTGITHFMGRKFIVDQNVLIPRPETEELVDWIISENTLENPVIWDIGAGSGCIAISLALGIKGAQVKASDISEEALQIAKTNNSELGTDVSFITSNILLEVPELDLMDILVSNPPYIPEMERERLHKNVIDNEPSEALFVPDNDPLLFYRRIAEVGLEKLKPRGYLYFESHENYAREVCDFLESLDYTDVKIKKDMQGKERMVRARLVTG